MCVKHIVTPENYADLQSLTITTDYCTFTVIADAVADPVAFSNSALHVGQSVGIDSCFVTVTEWHVASTVYFKDVCAELEKELNVRFESIFPTHVQKQYIPITDYSNKNNKYCKATYYKNLPGILTNAQRLYNNVFIVVDVKQPNVEIGDFKSAVTTNGTLTLNLSTKSLGWMSVHVEEEVIRFACRLHGKEQIVIIPFDALLAVYDPDGPTEIVSKGQIFDDKEVAVVAPVVEKPQLPKRPTFQVIAGGKTE